MCVFGKKHSKLFFQAPEHSRTVLNAFLEFMYLATIRQTLQNFHRKQMKVLKIAIDFRQIPSNVENVENIPEFLTNVKIFDYFGSFGKAFAKVECKKRRLSFGPLLTVENFRLSTFAKQQISLANAWPYNTVANNFDTLGGPEFFKTKFWYIIIEVNG